MKKRTYVYTVKNGKRDDAGNVNKTVRVWGIKKNTLYFVGERHAQYEDDRQMVKEIIGQNELPYRKIKDYKERERQVHYSEHTLLQIQP
jgi:hypothetical protein